MSDLSEQFVSEARDLIAQATDELIAIERDGVAAERIDRLLRAFHTLKGSAGLVEIPAMTLAMHAAEDLVGAIQTNQVKADAAVINQALACLDLVARWVDAFDANGELPPSAGDEARRMAEQLRSHTARTAGAPDGSAPGMLPAWASALLDAHRRDIGRALGSRVAELFAIAYEPHAGCFFDGDDPLQLLRQIPDLLALRVESPPSVHLADFDPYTCQLRFYAIAEGPRDLLSTIFRHVPDQVRIVDLPSDAIPKALGEVGATDMRGIVHAVIAEQGHMLRASGQPDGASGRVGAAARSAANALRHGGFDALANEVAEAGAVALAQSTVAPLLAALDHALDAMAAVTHPADRSSEVNSADANEDVASRWLRVPEGRIDALINLAGELIVHKNSFAHLARQVDAEGRQDLSRAMKREQEGIERLAAEFYELILALRMVPVGQILRPFPRMVRDLSQRFGKKVRLVTRGDTTESDKAVVDRLSEPLLHVVRNALDHGIEMPDVRAAAGKPETGSITIAVSRVGDRVAIEITDDGRGIDPAAIKRRARDFGLITEEALAAMSDEQALELIFSSGFSTATEISDISGRGVGMDVVRQAVDQLGGRVSVTSRIGVGATVRIDVPVSIATARIMVVECAGQRFGISMDSVTETVRLSSDRVRQVKSNEGFVLRDRVVPICSLAELIGLPGERRADGDARLLIVVEAGAKIAAVEIDAIRDRLDAVLKPMQGLLATARGYSGTTILGDGTVLLVLDLKDILP
jgi:two-component system chemotaxis sensor kinase CheA